MAAVSRSCLIVDDLEQVRLFFETALRHAGFDIIQAGNSAEAKARIDEHFTKIDVIVCDIHMPGQSNGLDFAEYVRHSYPTIPILLVTAHCEDDRLRQFQWLQKPFSVETLVSRVRAVAENRAGSLPA